MLRFYLEKIWKIISSFLLTVLMIVVVSVLGLMLLYKGTGNGLSFYKYEDYLTFAFTINGDVTTINYGNFPEADVIVNKHSKPNTLYETLTTNEQIVYDAIYAKGKRILETGDNSSKVRISIDNMVIEGIESAKTYEEIKELVEYETDKLDYEKIWNALHTDYGYYFWWEYDQAWLPQEANLALKHSKLTGSSFEIFMTPADCFKGEDWTINSEWVMKAGLFFDNAKLVSLKAPSEDKEKIEYFKNYILKEVSYDQNVADDMFAGIKNENVITSRTFFNVFDEDSSTNAICGGYTLAFQLLCDISDSDIYCYSVKGTMSDYSTYAEHAWNKVLSDGRYYLVDVTNTEEGTVGQNGDLFMKQIDNKSIYGVTTEFGETFYYTEIN